MRSSLNRMICAVVPLIPMMIREIFRGEILMDSLIINISPPFVKGGMGGLRECLKGKYNP
jgi:hypothetical protein